ncbi:MAG TPA: hypothetical protein VE978_22210 [Chitinophagales bacterium]|nr:hypothetical protein [Chitinophagales bacterium]
MTISSIDLYRILKDKMGDDQAKTLTEYIEAKVDDKFNDNKTLFSTKEDLANVKVDILRTIYIVGLVQFLAIVGSVLLIVNFMLK